MIAPVAVRPVRACVPDWHESFTTRILPAVRGYAHAEFQYLNREAREEAVAEATAAALVAYLALIRRGRQDLAFPSVMARFAVKHVQGGRHVGGHQNTCDVLSRAAQQRHGFQVDRLGPGDGSERDCLDLLEDLRATPAEIAIARIDLSTWFEQLSDRDRSIARALAIGHTTAEVAQAFGLTAGRISQLRRTFEDSWWTFQGEAC